MATFSWFNFYLSEAGRDFNLDLPATLARCRRGILVRFVFDFLLNHLIFGPLNIAVWRGVWGYAYYYFILVISATCYPISAKNVSVAGLPQCKFDLSVHWAACVLHPSRCVQNWFKSVFA